MPDYSQIRVNPSSKPPKPTRPKDPPSKTQKDEFIIEGSDKAGKSGKGLSTKEVMDIADIAVKLFNSKKYPTLYDDATLRERNRTQGAPTLRMSFQPTFDVLELATDIASNPTPVGIGIAVAKQLLKLDIMGEVEEQIANTRQIQLYEEDRHRNIASAEQKKREIEIQKLQSKNKVVFGDLQKRLSSSLSVRTSGKVEVPKLKLNKSNGRFEENNSRPVNITTIDQVKEFSKEKEKEAYKYLIENSTQNNGKNKVENFAWITKKSVIVLPTKGVNSKGEPFNNISDHAEPYVLPTKKENGKFYVFYKSKWVQVIASIHTHPSEDDEHWGSQGSADASFTVATNVPSYVVNENHLYVLYPKKSYSDMGSIRIENGKKLLQSGELSIIKHNDYIRKTYDK